METGGPAVSIIDTITQVWGAFGDSYFFLVFKFFAGIYAVVLFSDIVMLLMLRDVAGDWKKRHYGDVRPTMLKSTAQKRWTEIISRVGSGQSDQYKAAILEADTFVDGLLAEMGYSGTNMGDRIAGIKPGQIESIDDLQSAHAVRNRIIREASFDISKEEAENTLAQYKRFLEELELM